MSSQQETLSKRNSDTLVLASLLSNIADGMHTLALGKILYDMSGQVTAFASVIFFDLFIGIFSQIFAGPLVDRRGGRTIATRMSGLRIGLLLLLSYAASQQQLVLLMIVLSVLLKILNHFMRTANFALTGTSVLPDGLAVNTGRVNVALQVGQILGAAFAGLWLATPWASLIFVVDAFLVLLTLLCFIRIRPFLMEHDAAPATGQARSRWQQTISDWSAFAKVGQGDPFLLKLTLVSAFDFALVALLNVAMNPLVATRLRGEAIWLSGLEIAFALGAVFGTSVGSRLQEATQTRMAVRLYLLHGAQALLATVLAFIQAPWILIGSFFCFGLINCLSVTLGVTELQKKASTKFKGRLGSVRLLVISAVAALLLPFLGWGFTFSFERGMQILVGTSLALTLFSFAFMQTGASRAYSNIHS